MTHFQPGLVHTPVTPFKRDQSIDFDTYARIIEFHLRNGADALALPMPEGEDLSLTDEEQRKLLEFAIGQVKGRVPVIAHVSDAGTSIAMGRAVHAEQAGATAIVSHPPYFWHPRPAMVVEHLVQIGSAVRLPFFIVNPPIESAGTTLSAEVVLFAASVFFLNRLKRPVALARLTWRPLLAGAAMAAVLLLFRGTSLPVIVVGALVSVALYIAALLALRAVSPGEMALIVSATRLRARPASPPAR